MCGMLYYSTVVSQYGTAWQGQYEADNPSIGSVVVGEVLPRPVLWAPTLICSGPWRKANLRASNTSEVVIDQPGAQGRILHNRFVWSGSLYNGHQLFSTDRDNRSICSRASYSPVNKWSSDVREIIP